VPFEVEFCETGASPRSSKVASPGAPRGRAAWSSPGRVEALRGREPEALQPLGGGKPNREIAEELWVALDAVDMHATHVLDKLGAAQSHPGDRPRPRTRPAALPLRRRPATTCRWHLYLSADAGAKDSTGVDHLRVMAPAMSTPTIAAEPANTTGAANANAAIGHPPQDFGPRKG
jgi:hypothetical protein